VIERLFIPDPCNWKRDTHHKNHAGHGSPNRGAQIAYRLPGNEPVSQPKHRATGFLRSLVHTEILPEPNGRRKADPTAIGVTEPASVVEARNGKKTFETCGTGARIISETWARDR
jgi:hypothetical protein